MKSRIHKLVAMAGVLAWAGCSPIDDELSECGFKVDYELKLVTNIQTKLQTQLQTDLELQTNLQLTAALHTHLGTIFHNYAEDVDLSFYDVLGDSIRLEHDQHDMNGNEESYTLNIPRRHYMHLATANVKQEQSVEASDADNYHTSRLVQTRQDTIPSHTTSLFSARYDMDIKDSVSQTFNVHLYMANAATVLVVDTLGSGVRNIEVYATGFATEFNIADSTYSFADAAPIVRANSIDTPNDRQYACFSTVNFPSRNKVVIPVSSPHPTRADGVVGGLWEYHLYITTATGSITRSVLQSFKPLYAEQVLVVHAKLEPNGVPTTTDAFVGVSVTLNWNPGGEHNHEL